jgi:hypothetical protein
MDPPTGMPRNSAAPTFPAPWPMKSCDRSGCVPSGFGTRADTPRTLDQAH